MASKTSKADPSWTGRTIDFAAFSRDLAERRAVVGLVDPAHPELVEGRNSGKNRTPSKRALLAEIERLGGKW